MKLWRATLWVAVLGPACQATGRNNAPDASEPGSVVVGTVRLDESIALEPTRIENTTDPEICGEGQTLEDVLVSGERGLQNVIVSVRDAPSVTRAPETLVLDNVGCRFEPHAAVIMTGDTIEARNSDAVLHTTHLYGPKEMNFSLPVQGMTSSRVLTEPGVYAVKCDVHGWMQAYVRVDDHPFHAVTGADGGFRIPGLPEGRYTLEVWHERFGGVEREVDVRGGVETLVEVVYSP